jgi:hypothetical protein
VSNLSKDEMYLTTIWAFVPRFLQPFTALPEGRAPQALRSRTFNFGTSRGTTIDVFTLMVGAPGPSAPAPPGGPPRRFHVEGERSRTISSDTFWGPSIDIFTLMAGALGPSAPAPPGGPPSTFSRWGWALPDLQLWHLPVAHRRRFHVDGGRSRAFSYDTSRGPTVDVFMLMVGVSSTAV